MPELGAKMNPFNKIEHYKNRTRELVEESIFLDSRPLDKLESDKMEEFWKLSKSEKLLEVLHIIKKLLPKNFIDKIGLKEKIAATLIFADHSIAHRLLSQILF